MTSVTSGQHLSQAASQGNQTPDKAPAKDNWRNLMRSARMLATEGRLHEARDTMRQARDRGANANATGRFELRLALLEQDWKAVIAHAELLLERNVEISGNLALRAYKSYCTLGLWEGAYTFLRKVSVPAKDRTVLLRPLYNSLLSCTRLEDALKIIEEQVFGENGGPEHTVAFDVWAMQIGPANDKIAALVQRAQTTWPNDPVVAKNLSVRTSPRRHDTAGDDLDDIAYLRRDARALKEYTPDDPIAAIADQVVEAHIAKGLQRPLLRDEKSEFIISPEGSSGTSVLVFGGIGGRAAGISYPMLDGYFSARNATGLYTRDPNRLLTLGGIPKLGSTLDETVAALRQCLKDLSHHKRLVVLGTSGGGLGAIIYGARLKADVIHLMSPATSVDIDFLRKIGDTRAPALQVRLGNLVHKDARDGREILLQAPSPRVHVHYAADNPTDRAHAEHLKDLANVQLFPKRGIYDHNILPMMFACGEYEAMIDEICGTG
ncbi:hypothetical protein [Pseudophaeobacter flagellatus]|uniref:hypothetical protein n=1 Tax=Pseudophaeobacter flagellatus TaxID=2899119 RepID=UPI001E4494D7|nr:hypothetical protein [Pseudophaeobacter flagellatus]MCD9148078.1 hypothetical protein [Pseudophaeobacter flagellatus]